MMKLVKRCPFSRDGKDSRPGIRQFWRGGGGRRGRERMSSPHSHGGEPVLLWGESGKVVIGRADLEIP